MSGVWERDIKKTIYETVVPAGSVSHRAMHQESASQSRSEFDGHAIYALFAGLVALTPSRACVSPPFVALLRFLYLLTTGIANEHVARKPGVISMPARLAMSMEEVNRIEP